MSPAGVPRTTSFVAVAVFCWRESRPTVQIIFQLRFLAGFLLSGGVVSGVGGVRLIGGALVWACSTMAVYLLNGYSDVVEDRVNGSRRPIATGQLPTAVALRVALTLGAVGLIGAAVHSVTLLILTTVFLVVGAAYSLPPLAIKRWTGGVMVVAIVGGVVTYLAGADFAGDSYRALLPFAGLLTAWMGLVGATTKDLPDAAGDVAAGRRTVVGTRGERVARRLAAGAALTVALAAVLVVLLVAPDLVLPACVLVAGGVGVAASVLTTHSVGDRSRRHRPYRIFMITQYVAHLSLLVRALTLP